MTYELLNVIACEIAATMSQINDIRREGEEIPGILEKMLFRQAGQTDMAKGMGIEVRITKNNSFYKILFLTIGFMHIEKKIP